MLVIKGKWVRGHWKWLGGYWECLEVYDAMNNIDEFAIHVTQKSNVWNYYFQLFFSIRYIFLAHDLDELMQTVNK